MCICSIRGRWLPHMCLHAIFTFQSLNVDCTSCGYFEMNLRSSVKCLIMMQRGERIDSRWQFVKKNPVFYVFRNPWKPVLKVFKRNSKDLLKDRKCETFIFTILSSLFVCLFMTKRWIVPRFSKSVLLVLNCLLLIIVDDAHSWKPLVNSYNIDGWSLILFAFACADSFCWQGLMLHTVPAIRGGFTSNESVNLNKVKVRPQGALSAGRGKKHSVAERVRSERDERTK